ncbi:MAG: hypothetical protein ABJN39_10550 [Sulfitobacter sp.]|uniref:hypothetical protein n=2 Tax=Alphaproteobacteria TaxID=28211 RepID=UPI003297875F
MSYSNPVLNPWGNSRVPLLVVVFLSLDFLFIGVNAVWRLLELTDLVADRPVLIEIRNDYGLPEITNFAKYLVVSALLILGVRRTERRIWGPMAIAFGLLFLDDAFRIHENVSEWVGQTFLEDLVGPGKPSFTIGQFPYYIIFGIAVFGTAFLSMRRATGRGFALSKKLFNLLIVLAVLGAGVDFVNSYILESFGIAWLGSLGSLVENGGELIVLSLCVWVAVLVRELNSAKESMISA